MTRTEGISVGATRMLPASWLRSGRAPKLKITRAEGIPLGVMRMLIQLVTRTEGVSVRVIRMLSQLVGPGSVERAIVKFTKKCILLMNLL